jgi:hypothetical protein
MNAGAAAAIRLLPLTAIVAVACQFASPALADDAETCAAVDKMVQGNNETAPYMVDQVTRAEVATYDCAAKTAAFSWTVLANQADLQDSWGDLLAANFRNGLCARPGLAAVVNAGWEISATWTTKDGQTYSTVATCP